MLQRKANIRPASLPVYSSHSVQDPNRPAGDQSVQEEPESHKQRALQLVDAGHCLQPPIRFVQDVTSTRADTVKEKNPSPRKYCSSYVHHTNIEDTFAAYCHPQPILSTTPSPTPAALHHLTMPRLISSVSETGLDAKHLLPCCNLNCLWVSSLPPGSLKQPDRWVCSGAVRGAATTRDVGTMTVWKELKDAGVQTGQTTAPHVFPQICVTEENDQISLEGKKQGGATKSPVKEVKWDAEGMTWEVYGASVDPEELGLAIQRHLELQIKETASRAVKLSRQNTNTSRHSRNSGSQRKRGRMMSSIRPPACCSGTTAVD